MKNTLKILFPVSFILLFLGFTNCAKDDNNGSGYYNTGVFKDIRDNKKYKWVRIGHQVWMAENLAYKVDTGGCYTYWDYNNHTDIVETYGYLYNWDTAMEVAPEGWHIPSRSEWWEMVSFLRNSIPSSEIHINYLMQKSLASDSGWCYSKNIATVGNSDYPEYRNKSGFNALPGGYRDHDRKYKEITKSGYWWTSNEYSENGCCGYFINIKYNSRGYDLDPESKSVAFSVRCVKDIE